PALVAAIASLSPDTLILASGRDFPCKRTFLGKILTLSEGVCRSLDTRPRRSYRCPMPLPPRLPWQPPWLTVERILHEHPRAEQWKESQKPIPGLLKERERIRKAGGSTSDGSGTVRDDSCWCSTYRPVCRRGTTQLEKTKGRVAQWGHCGGCDAQRGGLQA